MRKTTTSFLLLLLFTFSQTSYPQNELPADKIFESVNNSVVVIFAYKDSSEIYQGSGVVVNSEGYIVTNLHIVKGSEWIQVRHYGKNFYNVKTIASDEKNDLLILQVDSYFLNPVSFGNYENLKHGKKIYAIGSPEGFENSISDGIVSGFRKNENGVEILQMTAPITEGSSGGAIVNAYGELVALSTSGIHEGNLYFGVPVTQLIDILDRNQISYTVGKIHTENSNENFVEQSEQSVSTDSKQKNDADYYTEANIAYEKQDYPTAILFFSKHIEKNNGDALCYLKRGYSHTKLNEYRQAINDFTESIREEPNSFETYFYRGNAYYALFEFERALLDYNKAIELSPAASLIYYNRGYTQFKLKNYSYAVSDWERAVNLEPSYDSELNEKIQTAKSLIKKN